MARAQTYPARPIHLIVGFPPGGTADILARLTGQMLSERLGQPIVVENRPGAGGNLATEAVVRAPADGYTLLFIANPNVISAMITPNVNFNIVRDIAPIAGICLNPLIMEVNPAVPVKTVPEFIAYAKANPGKINMASGGIGSTPHLAGELFKMMTGVNMRPRALSRRRAGRHRPARRTGSGDVRHDHPVASSMSVPANCARWR